LLRDFWHDTLAVQADGCTIEMSESLAEENGELSDLQKSFRKHHALQYGYCTPGIQMSSTAFLRENPRPTKEEI
jgi:carbon-monoxide dehydrogenase small subunit